MLRMQEYMSFTHCPLTFPPLNHEAATGGLAPAEDNGFPAVGTVGVHRGGVVWCSGGH